MIVLNEILVISIICNYTISLEIIASLQEEDGSLIRVTDVRHDDNVNIKFKSTGSELQTIIMLKYSKFIVNRATISEDLFQRLCLQPANPR